MDVHFSSKTNEWYTPQYLFDKLNDKHNFNLISKKLKINNIKIIIRRYIISMNINVIN